MTERKECLLNNCLHELRMVMTACIRSTQAEARQNPSVERELGTDATPSHGAMDSYQPFRGGRVSVFYEYGSWRVNHTTVEDHASKNIWVARNGPESCCGRDAELGE